MHRQARITDEELIESVDHLAGMFSRQYRLSYEVQDEVKQEIALALTKARKDYDPKRGSWRQFSFHKAKFAVVDFFRTGVQISKRWNRKTGEVEFDIPLEEVVHEPAINEAYEHLYVDEFLQHCKSPKERFITLCLLAGFSQADMERMLGIGLGSLSRSIQRLRIVSSRYSSFAVMD